jgi:1-acyl-sn-glycerol-3-phosphate acyltransferase
MGNVKKKIINPLKEDLSSPALIICNHQSSLDIVPLIMLHPKILMLTNNKKWNAPFFGPVIRMADYFPPNKLNRI